MHYGWNIGILLFFHAISGIVSEQEGPCPYSEFSGCTCAPTLNPARITCTDTTRDDFPRNYASTNRLRVLDMSGSRIKELKPMMLASGYETVKGLVLKNNWITNIDRAALDNQNSLIELDLRNNHIKTLPRGIFSQRKFRLLYLANNSFSCDDTNLVGEIKDLINSMTDVKLETGASNLRVFDYEMLRCAEPAHMKGRKIVDVISELRGKKASFLGTAGAVTGLTSGVIAALLTLVIAAAIILVKRLKLDGKYRYNFLSSTDKGSMEQNQKESETVVNEQEQGKVVAQRLQKVRRQSQGYPAKENMESEDDT